MDVLNLFAGVNVAMVAGIIGILLGVRAIDRGKKLGSGAYIIGAMVLGFLAAALVVNPWTPRAWLASGIAHAGAASILYQFGKLVIPGNDTTVVRRNGGPG
jgi:hypothetical protein